MLLVHAVLSLAIRFLNSSKNNVARWISELMLFFLLEASQEVST